MNTKIGDEILNAINSIKEIKQKNINLHLKTCTNDSNHIRSCNSEDVSDPEYLELLFLASLYDEEIKESD
ncbi:MAG: hypothetical protein HQK51_19980 [Oligoflexia bacterium]|nr:hypothetical protein [Oligoflexia bacterium]